jgi:hypothetical protein
MDTNLEGPAIIEGYQERSTSGLQVTDGGLPIEKNAAICESYGINYYR